MAWYHKYQHAELIAKPGKAYPIVRYAITDSPRRIVSCQLQISRSPLITDWFDRAELILYGSRSALARLPEQQKTENVLRRIFKSIVRGEFL